MKMVKVQKLAGRVGGVVIHPSWQTCNKDVTQIELIGAPNPNPHATIVYITCIYHE